MTPPREIGVLGDSSECARSNAQSDCTLAETTGTKSFLEMDLSGALSNPLVMDKPLLTRPYELHGRLLEVAAEHPRQAS
jgi:hypothetical protein